MPCIWGRHNKSQLFINVAILPADLIANLQKTTEKFSTQLSVFTALIDTGAQSTCITKTVADTVGLKPIGQVPIMSVSGEKYHNNYLFHVAFVLSKKAVPSSKPVQGDMHIYSTPIQGAELGFDGRGFDVLLGMDIIGSGSLAIEGVGTFSFSF